MCTLLNLLLLNPSSPHPLFSLSIFPNTPLPFLLILPSLSSPPPLVVALCVVLCCSLCSYPPVPVLFLPSTVPPNNLTSSPSSLLPLNKYPCTPPSTHTHKHPHRQTSTSTVHLFTYSYIPPPPPSLYTLTPSTHRQTKAQTQLNQLKHIPYSCCYFLSLFPSTTPLSSPSPLTHPPSPRPPCSPVLPSSSQIPLISCPPALQDPPSTGEKSL